MVIAKRRKWCLKILKQLFYHALCFSFISVAQEKIYRRAECRVRSLVPLDNGIFLGVVLVRGLGMERTCWWSLVCGEASAACNNHQSVARASAANQSNNPITMADSGDHAPTDIKAEAPQATTADQTAASTADDIEAAVDVDTEMQTDNSHTMDNSSNAKSTANANMDGTSDDAPTVSQIETRMPAKKDVALRDFLSKMDEYAPIVSSLQPQRDALHSRPPHLQS